MENKHADFSDLPPMLDESLLALRTTLPLKPAQIKLEGRKIRLEPLEPDRDAGALFAVSNGTPVTLDGRHVGAYDADALVWRYMSSGPYASAEELHASLQQQCDASNGLCLCVSDVETSRQIGVANLMNNVPADLKIELGGIWYSPIMQGTGANLEATYLMLRHVFDVGYRRAEWKCHSDNMRSRRAALRMGFTFEGIQEAHMIVKDRSRDTAWFRMLNHEWPEKGAALKSMLYES